jgi:cytoskeletal protein CcmA (bactofilin family)
MADVRPQQISGVLEEGTSFEGKVSFVGTLRIGGKFRGEIFSKDTLIIDETGVVEGEINVGELVIKGDFSGQIEASRMVTMLSPAKFKGVVSTPNLKIEEGVHFDGASSPPKPL